MTPGLFTKNDILVKASIFFIILRKFAKFWLKKLIGGVFYRVTVDYSKIDAYDPQLIALPYDSYDMRVKSKLSFLPVVRPQY